MAGYSTGYGQQPPRSYTPQDPTPQYPAYDPYNQQHQQHQQQPDPNQQHYHQQQPPYDPYNTHQHSQPADYSTGGPDAYGAHNPFDTPGAYSQQHEPTWAQPVPGGGGGASAYPSQHDLGDPYAAGAHSGPGTPLHLQPTQTHDPTDDEPDSAPLLAGHAHGHAYARWSTTGQGAGQADPTLVLPGGIDPTAAAQGHHVPYDPAAQGGYGYGGVGGWGGQGGYPPAPGGDDAQSIVQYGRIPQRQPRRYKTVKRASTGLRLVSLCALRLRTDRVCRSSVRRRTGVQLYHGNLVLDCQVPPKLLERCARKDDREFTHMRYTAATCDVRLVVLAFVYSAAPEGERPC